MKSIFLIIVFMISFLTPVNAGLEVPGEADPSLAKVYFSIEDKPMVAEKIFTLEGVYLEVRDAQTQQVFWKSDIIGEFEKHFIINERKRSMVAIDMAGNDIPELLVSTSYSPNNSALYVFSYQSSDNTFKPISFVSQDLSRDFLVSDIPQENGLDLVINEDKTFRSLGYIYPDTPAQDRMPGYYYYKFDQDSFQLVRSEPVPVE